jgi:zinc protease
MIDFLRTRLASGHVVLLAALLLVGLHLPAAESPKPADINARFRNNPDVSQSVKNFEGESREIFQKRDEIVAACGLQAGLDVADVGAGTGLFTRLFAPLVAPGKVYAVDISKKFIEHIERTCREQNLTNVKGIVCSDDSTGLAADSVDLVFICDTYHHFERPEKSLASIRQALRTGGRLVIVEFEKIPGVTAEWVMNHVRPDKQMVIQEVKAAGFQLIDEPQESMSGQYILQFRKSEPPRTGAAQRKIFPYHAVQETLPNGLKAMVIPLDSPGLVTYWSVVRTGSRDEVEPGRSGFAHFFEHMMFRGTKKYPGPVYDEIVTSLGADSNAYTTDDLTAYHMTFAKEDLERVVEIESDRFQNLSYEKPAFQTEAGAVYGEYRKGITHPFSLLDEKLRDLAYDVHTYKHTTIGFEADIEAMPEAYQYSQSFFQRFYRPDNVVILIVGDVDPPAAIDLVRKYYSDWKPGYVPPQIVPEPPQTAERTGSVQYPGKTLPILQISYKGDAFDPDNPEYVAALLLADLAFGETSEIYKKFVLEEQKLQALEAYVPMNRDVPLFDVIAMVKDAADVDLVRDEIYRTLERFQAAPADAEKLAQLKRRHKYGFLMHLDTPDSVAGALARPIALTGGIECVDRLYEALDRATPDDIMRAARKYFVPARRTVMVLKGTEG